MFEQAHIICERKSNQKPLTETAFSVADEIKKFKELLDDGIITEEEFHKKKLELLR
ncbi:SHOCT domain-containing protein [Shouchella lehensis]|uniref:SHOCT domain-containing protein n=1 Tax=Shouchella lehensis TaxID=300825 RepID=UPI0018CEC337|nr:SHOCT domain-containing protein [Shouchella lehensis]